MPEREGEVDEQLVGGTLRRVMLLDDVVDMGDCSGDQQTEDESDDVVVMTPDGDVDRVEDDDEGETPTDSIDDDRFCVCGHELVDDSSKEEKMDEGPDGESPRGGSNISLFYVGIDGSRSSNGVNVATEEEKVDEDINDLE